MQQLLRPERDALVVFAPSDNQGHAGLPLALAKASASGQSRELISTVSVFDEARVCGQL